MSARTRRWMLAGAVVGMLFASFAPELGAQTRRGGGNRAWIAEYSRNNARIRKVFAPAVARAFASTVKVYREGKVVALGTVVGEAGLILTKASELGGGAIAVAFGSEEARHAAEVIGTDEPNDLALLHIDKKGLAKVRFAVDNATKTGSFVVTAATVAMPLAYGVMSVARHRRKGQIKLGVYPEAVTSGMRLTRIVLKSPAATAGLRVGDIIKAIDGKVTKNRPAFSAAITSHAPGSKMKLEVIREDKVIDVVATMVAVGDRHGPISSQERSRLWGPLSRVRIGFEEVIQHDSVIRPEDCGGPLCDLEGEVVGINIARVGRFETLAVTSKVVVASIARILAAAPAKSKHE